MGLVLMRHDDCLGSMMFVPWFGSVLVWFAFDLAFYGETRGKQ